MPGRPCKKRRKSKDEPKKWGKNSRKGVKMTCSICKKTGHNKVVCARVSNTSHIYICKLLKVYNHMFYFVVT